MTSTKEDSASSVGDLVGDDLKELGELEMLGGGAGDVPGKCVIWERLILLRLLRDLVCA